MLRSAVIFLLLIFTTLLYKIRVNTQPFYTFYCYLDSTSYISDDIGLETHKHPENSNGNLKSKTF